MHLQNKITRSRAEFELQRTNFNRGERSLLTTGVNLWNAHLMGEGATGLPALRGQLMASLLGCGSSLTGLTVCPAVWLRTVALDSCQLGRRHASPRLYDHAAVFFHFIF